MGYLESSETFRPILCHGVQSGWPFMERAVDFGGCELRMKVGVGF